MKPGLQKPLKPVEVYEVLNQIYNKEPKIRDNQLVIYDNDDKRHPELDTNALSIAHKVLATEDISENSLLSEGILSNEFLKAEQPKLYNQLKTLDLKKFLDNKIDSVKLDDHEKMIVENLINNNDFHTSDFHNQNKFSVLALMNLVEAFKTLWKRHHKGIEAKQFGSQTKKI
nr:5364_t:CDS:2 [Entrophospora candida]